MLTWKSSGNGGSTKNLGAVRLELPLPKREGVDDK